MTLQEQRPVLASFDRHLVDGEATLTKLRELIGPQEWDRLPTRYGLR